MPGDLPGGLVVEDLHLRARKKERQGESSQVLAYVKKGKHQEQEGEASVSVRYGTLGFMVSAVMDAVLLYDMARGGEERAHAGKEGGELG